MILRLIVSVLIVWLMVFYLTIPFYKYAMRFIESEKKRISKELDYKNTKTTKDESESGFDEF